MDSEGATKQKSARNLANTDNRWINIQQSTFTNWCNERLKGTETRIDNLITDLDDGVRLIVLLEQLAKRPVPRYNKNPRGPFQKLENLESALDFIQRDEGIYLVNIGALDLTDHKRHLILGLVWHLILHYQIFGHRRRDTPTSPTPLTSPASLIALPPAGGKPAREPPGKSANKLLLNWLKATMPEDVPVRNITTDWNDGKKLSALVNIMKPGLCPDYNSLSPSDALPNTKKAMEQAKEEFGVPQVIDPEHLCMDKPDELSCMTYLSYFCSGEDSPGYNNLLEWVRSKIPEYNIENFTDDWRDGRALSALVNAVAEGSLPGHAQLDPKRPVDNVREAMKTANDNLDGLVDNITPEEFAHKKTDALAMMGYIEWYRKAHVKKSEAVSAMGPATTKEQEVEEPKQEVEEPKQKVEEPKQEAEEPKQKVEEPKQAVEEPEVELYSPPMSPPQVELKLDWGDQMDGSQEQLDTDNGPELKENEEEEEEVWESPLVDLGLTNARVAKPAAFTVDCRRAGPGNLSTSIKSPSGNDVPVTMSGEGMHSAEYTPQEVGPHNIVVLYSGHQVNGSPFTAIVRDPSKVVAKGDGLENGTMGEKAEFTVSTEGAGPGKPVVKVTGSKGELSCDVEELYDHNYKYSYVPQSTGPHACSVVFAEEDVPGSPFTSHSLPAVHPDRVVVKDLPKGPLYATRQYSVTVDTRKAGSGEVSGRAESGSSSSSTVECAVEEAESGGGGVYSVKFTPTQSGSLALRLQFAGQEVPTSPLLFTAVDLRDVKLTPPTPGPLGVFVVDQPYSYTVVTGDSSGGVALQVTEARTGATVPTKIRYLGNTEYLATMTCPEVGVYDAVVCYEGEPVHHAHHSLNVCDKPRPDRVVCSGLSHDGHVISLSADTSKAGPGKLTAVAKGETVGEVPVKVIPKTRNTSRVEVGAARPDLYHVEVRWQGDPVGGSPFTLDTRPNLAGITVEGAGLAHAVAGEKAEFTVSTKGAGPGKPVVKVTGPKGKVPCVVEKLNNHNYKYSYVPQSTGPHAISVVFAEEDVPGSPFTAQVKEAIHPDRVVVKDLPKGPLYATRQYSVTVDTRKAGSGEVSGRAESGSSSSSAVECAVEEAESGGEGVYSVKFTPTKRGSLALHLQFAGQKVPTSPLLFTAVDLRDVKLTPPTPGPLGVFVVDQPYSYTVVTGDSSGGVALQVTEARTGATVPTKIRYLGNTEYLATMTCPEVGVYDAVVCYEGEPVHHAHHSLSVCDKPRPDRVVCSGLSHDGHVVSLSADTSKAGPGKLTAVAKGETVGEVPVKVIPKTRNTSRVEVGAAKPDLYRVEVRWQGDPVGDSPFTLDTRPNLDGITVEGAGLAHAVAGEKAEFTVSTKEAGPGKPVVKVTGPKGKVPCVVEKLNNHNYNYSYVPQSTGPHAISVVFAEEDVPGSPFTAQVKEAIHPDRVVVKDLPKGPLYATRQYSVTVDTRKAGSGEVSGRAESGSSSSSAVECVVEEAESGGEGVYSVKFTPTKRGSLALHLQFAGQEVPTSPLLFTAVDLRDVKLTPPTPGLLGVFVVDQPYSYTVATRDSSGGVALQVTEARTGATVPTKIRYLGNAEYLATVTCPEVGVYDAVVCYEGEPVHHAHHSLNVCDKPRPDRVVCSGLSHDGHVISLSANTSKAGPGKLTAVAKGETVGEVPVKVIPKTRNAFRVEVGAAKPDLYRVEVRWQGDPVGGSPFTLDTRPNLAGITVEGAGLAHAVAGEKAEFTVSTKGAGPGKPVVKVTGPKGKVPCVVEKLNDHNYNYSYVPQSTGPHAISVVFAEEDVPGSPFTAQVKKAIHPDRVVVKDLPKGPLYATRQYSVTVDTRKAGSGEVSGRAESGSSSSSAVECAVEEAESGGGGVYSVKFTPTQSGSLALRLQFAGQEVPTSPLLFTAVDLRDVKLTPPTPGPLGVFVVDQPYSYTVATGDSSGGVALQVTEARTGATVPTKIRYLGNAEYLATMTCPEVGVYDAVVCYEGEPVHHAHHSLNVCDKPRPDRVVCSGLSHDGHVISLSANTSKAGPGKLTAVAKGETVGEVPVKVIPKTRNTSRVEVGAAKPDLYRVEVRWQGDPVGGSPFTLDTRPNLDGIAVEGAGLAHAVAGEKAEFTVSIKGAGPGKPVVKVTGPKGKVPCVVEKLNDHNYKYSYVPQSTGPHAISVVIAEEDVSGSPFTAQVKEAIPVDARKVAADGPHFPQMHRGPVFTDLNVSRAGDGQLSSTCHSNKFGSVPVAVSPPNEGVQRASFDPSGKDLYQQSVLWSGEHVPGSPFPVDLNPPLASEVRVDGPHPCIEGLGPVRTNIDVREAGDGQLTVKTSGERLGPVPTKVDPSGEEGRFRAEFQASQPDTYLQEVKWSGRAVPGSPFRVPVDLGEAMCLQEEIQDVESSYLPDSMADLYDQGETNQYTHSEPPEAIPSYFVGEKLSITADKEGDEPAGPVVAGCRGDTAGEIPVNLVSNPDGSRTAIIDPRVPDLYSVQVTMSGEHVPGSPFKVRYLPPPTDPSKCRLYNLPPSERRLVAHDDIMYSVDASQAGAGGLSIQSEGPSGVKTSTNLQVVPKENQDFKILYTPTNAGLHKHYIYWGKEAIPQSPVEFEVDPRDIPVYPWAKSVALDYEFPGLKAKDVSGHVLYQPSGKKVKSSVDKNKTQPEKMVASFKPLEAGIYEVHLLHHKNHVRGSPFEVRVLEPPRPDSVRVSGLEDAKCYVGDSVPFRADCSGAGTGELQMKVEGPAGEQEPSQLDILDNKDGTYSATFVPATEGNHLLHVKWAGKPVKKSPFKLTAASLPARSSPLKSDPSKCFILPEDVETMSSPYQHSQQVDFRVSTLNAGPGTLNVTSRGPGKADVVITDNKDGIYSVRFNPSSPGRYKLDVTWDEVSIRGSPCDVMVDGGSDGGRWVKSGLDLSNCLFALGKKHHFLANCEELGEGDFAVQVEPATAASATVQDLGNRTYHVTLVPKQQGEHKVCVLHGNQHILGSPFACQFQQVGDASKCRLLEDAEEQQHEMGEKVSFLVTTEGAGPGVLSASVENIQKKTSAPADVEQTGDTTYRVTFDPGQEEEYMLSIKYDSAHIIGSPCTVVQES